VTITNRVSLRSVESGITPIDDVPDAPTIGAATNVGTSRAYNNGSATVAYTAAATGGPVTTFTATSTPGGFTATGASPITVTGLQSATSYTFTVSATSAQGTQTSASSSSITATTVPQAPTIGTATNASGQSYSGSASISVPFTAGATGGAAVSTYTVTSSSGATGTGASSPVSVSETVGNPTSTARTYTVTATNANGTSTASSASNSIAAVSVPQAPTIGAVTAGNASATVAYTASSNTGGAAITTYTATSSPGGLTGTGASPITVSGLTNGTAYTFTVTATNSAGTSAASSASSAVTPIAPVGYLGVYGTSGGTALDARAVTSYGATGLVGGSYNGGQLWWLMNFSTSTLSKSSSIYGNNGVGANSFIQGLAISVNRNTSFQAVGFMSGSGGTDAIWGDFVTSTLANTTFRRLDTAAVPDVAYSVFYDSQVYWSGMNASNSGVVQKMLFDGTVVWTRQLEGGLYCFASGISGDNGKYYAVGRVQRSSGIHAANIAVYDASGNYSFGAGLASTTAGSVTEYTATAARNAGFAVGYAPNSTVLITKHNESNGALAWQRFFTGGGTKAVSVAVTSTNPAIIYVLTDSGYILKYDNTGGLTWQRRISPSSGSFTPNSITYDLQNSPNFYLVTGTYTPTSGAKKAVVLKMPIDGSGAGNSVTIGGVVWTYSTGSGTDSAGNLTSASADWESTSVSPTQGSPVWQNTGTVSHSDTVSQI
jgi:hypothetical protein